MPSTFPAMNPYLEHPAFWSSFHARLLVAIADTLAPQLLPNYYIDVETRIYQDQDEDEVLVGIPDGTVLSANLSNPTSKELQQLDTGSTLTSKASAINNVTYASNSKRSVFGSSRNRYRCSYYRS